MSTARPGPSRSRWRPGLFELKPASRPRIGILGSLVWDSIHGRDPAAAPIEEWGGIAYALGGFDAALSRDWQMVPLIKVGSDLREEAAEFLRDLTHLVPGGTVCRGYRCPTTG